MDHHANVVANYQKKKFSSCLSLIDKAPRGIRETTHYKVLKASCLVNMGQKVIAAHELLVEVIAKEAENAFAYYVKGLAFMHQKNFQEAIASFNKAIKHDKTGSMQKAREMKDEAIKMMTSDGVGGNNESIVSDAKKEKKSTKSANDNLPTTMTAAKVMEVGKVEEKKKSEANLKKCNICSKTFTKTSSLVRHKALHTGDRPFKCADCDFAFVQKSDLKRHGATHKGTPLKFRGSVRASVQSFSCSTCNKTFKTKENLQGHQLVHSSDRPFKCTLCSKNFKLESLLKVHQNSHKPANEDPFQCDWCGKTFPTKQNIDSHITTHFNAKLFACNLCKFTYSTVVRFGHHFREFHLIGKGNV